MTRSEVLVRGKPRFSMCGERLPDNLIDTDQEISAGLVARLDRYALKVLQAAGFDVQYWSCNVYTMDGDLPPSDRTYCVEFTNERGGLLGVQGILTSRGWPILDHGFVVDRGRKPEGPQ